jgi:hypothetical protein
MTQVMKNVYVTIYITTTNYNINVIPNPRQGGGAFFSRRTGVRDLVLRHFTGLPSRSNSSVYQLAARSFQSGLRDSTSLSFFGRLQPLISPSCNGDFDIREPFEIYEAITIVFLRDSTTQYILVLPYALFQPGADTCIERRDALPIM